MTRQQRLSGIAAKPTFRTIDGVSTRVVESGAGNADALLLSPWPESVFATEPIWSRWPRSTLGRDRLARIGRSERKRRADAPRAMGEFDSFARPMRFLASRIPMSSVGRRHGSVALRRSLSPRSLSKPRGWHGRCRRTDPAGEPLRQWVFAPDLEPYRQIGGRAIVERVIGTLERYTVSEAAREDYLASFEGDRFAESMRYVQSYPTELVILRDALPRIQTPVRIIAGLRDAVVPPVNASFLHERLPAAICSCSTPAISCGRTPPTNMRRS